MLKLKNKLKKFSILMCTMLVTVTNLSLPTYAANVTVTHEIDNSAIQHGYEVEGEMHNDDGGTHTHWTMPGYFALSANGQNVFCIEPWKRVDDGTTVSQDDLNAMIDYSLSHRLSRIGYYGFWSVERTRENYITTQLMIWEARGWSVTKKPAYYDAKKQLIEEKIDRSATQLSFTGQSKNAKVNETVSFTDTNGVLADYMKGAGYPNPDVSYHKDGVNFYWHGNTIYLQPTADAGDTFTFTSFNVTSSYVGIPIVYYNGNSQKTSPLNKVYDPAWSTFTLNIQKYGNLKIAKQNEKGEMVPNTTFKLSYQANMSSPIGTYTTGDDGTVTIQELEPKTVYIQELSVPHPLEVDTSVHPVTIKPNDTVTYTQTNQYKRGNLKLAKVDEDGTYIPNTQFKLSYHNDMSDPIGIYTTGSDGTVTVEDLIADTVYIQEISVPAPLILDDSVKSKVIGHNTIVTYTARNLYKKGDVEITKKDANSGKVVKKSGVEFDIFKKDGSANGTYIATIATNSQGVALYKNLRYGDYYFVEKTQPPKYYISNERINFQIREDKVKIQKTLSNPQIRGKIILTKEDCEVGKRPQGDGTLDGAIYTLYAQEDILDPADDSVKIKAGTEVMTATIKDYTATFDNLYLGKYRIKETKPPKKGYLLDGKDYIVNLTDTEHIKTVTSCDPVKKQAFKLAKFKSSNSAIKPNLPGAEFTVILERYVQKYGWDQALRIAKDENDDRILSSEWDVLTTDNEGTAESKKLPYGKYRVKETKIPGKPGELQAVPDFFVNIDEDSDIVKPWIFLEDDELRSIVAIEKEDSQTHNTIRLANATFKVKCLKDNGEFHEGDYVGWWQWSPIPHYVNTFHTDDRGVVMLPEELPVGMYQVEEIESPIGYLIGATSTPFEITANTFHQQLGPDDETIITTVIYEDTPVKGKVKVQKEAMLFKEYVSTQTEYGELFTPVYERGLLPGVKFEIRAETDIVGADETTWYTAGQRVAVLTTDGKTITTSGELPLGTEGHNIYSIREIETAEGYVLDDTIHYFRFDYVDGNTAIVDPTWLDENGEVIEKAEVLTLDNKHQASIALAKKVMEQSDLKDKAEAYKKVVFGIFADQVEHLEKDSLVSIVDVEEDGTASAKLTQKGSYYLKELTTDPDYEPSTEKYPFTYTYNGDQLQEIEVNEGKPIYNLLKRGEIEIYKQDADSKLPLKNVCFELATDKEFTNIIKTTWTDENGKAIFGELEVNYTYYIREQYGNENDMIHKGYVYDPTIHEVNLETIEVVKVNVTNTQVKGKVQFTKTGESFHRVEIVEGDFGKEHHPIWEQGNLLGAELTVKAAEDITTWDQTIHYEKGDIVTVLESDWQTTDSLLLPVGKYEAYESKTPHGYLKDETIYEFEIKPNGKADIQLNPITIHNQRAKVNLNLIKQLEKQEVVINKDAYQDVVYGLFAREDIYDYMGKVVIENGSLIGISQIDENGHLTKTFDLPNAVYYLKELQTNEQYNLDPTEYDFEVGYQGEAVKEYTIEINHGEPVYNYLKRGSIELIKQDEETEKPLKNVCFELATDKDFKNIIKTTWTDEKGRAIFDELEINHTYYIREQYGNENDMIHKGYVYDPTIYEVKLHEHKEIVNVKATNQKVRGKVQFTKTGESFQSVEIIEGEFGKEHHPIWKQGNLLGAQLTIKAAEDITTWDQTTHYKKGDVVTIIESDWQTADSLILPAGKYEAYESKTPQGYLKDETIYEFEIEPNGKAELQLNPITINNKRAKVKLDFTKKLAKQEVFVNEQAYKDVIFGLYAKEDISTYTGAEKIKKDTLIYALHIDEDGKLIMDDYLPSGEFYLKELKTNEQYELDPTAYEFKIDYEDNKEENTVTVNNGKPIVNELKRGSIEIIKMTKDEVHYSKAEQKYADSFHAMDEYAKIYKNPLVKEEVSYLAGVTFELATDETFEHIIETKKTDGDGRIVFKELELGTYYIREKASLKHYVLSDEVFKVELTKHGQVETIEVNNELVKANIGIHKVDEENHSIVLKGAEFTMYADQECTKKISTVVTNELGNALFKDLSFGTTVYIKETKAPEGYELSGKVIKVTINDKWLNKDIQHRVIEITNHKIPEIPNTGDNTNIVMYLGLLGISLAAIFMATKKRYMNR